ncbi:MAG: alpha/beta fold hydrolase [Pirellulales bacterium]
MWEAVNAALGTRYEADAEEYELSAPLVIALKLLDENSASFSIDKQDDELIVRFAHPERATARLEIRRLLSRLTGEAFDAWPTDRGLRLPDDFDAARRSVVLLHGFQSNRAVLEPLTAVCRRLGLQTLIFDYPNQGPIAWSGERLAADSRALSEKHPDFRTAIVAHSMGGLVARYALECDPRPPSCVTDLVTLGTPHHGAEMAELAEWLTLLSALDAKEFPLPDPRKTVWAKRAGIFVPAVCF